MLDVGKSISKHSLPVHLVIVQESNSVRLKASLLPFELVEGRLGKDIEVKRTGHKLPISLIPGKGTNSDLKCEELRGQKSVLVVYILMIIILVPSVMF